LNHPTAVMLLEFLPVTVHYQVLPERFVYMPKELFLVMLCLHLPVFILLGHRLVTDPQFIGRR